MKNSQKLKFLLIILPLVFTSYFSFSQEIKTSKATGFELIFSSSNFENPSINTDPVIRFTGFFNWRNEWHYNFSKSVGLFTGFNIRNIGMINKFKNPLTNNEERIKQRSYTLGLPLGFKVGNMDNTLYFYAGGEIELAFHYKEKRFENGEKYEKRTAWFSDKTERFLPSVYAGFQLPTGTNISFKYYLSDFLNTNYSDSELNFSGTSSNIFYVSVSVLIHDTMLGKLGDSKSPTVPATQSAGL